MGRTGRGRYRGALGLVSIFVFVLYFQIGFAFLRIVMRGSGEGGWRERMGTKIVVVDWRMPILDPTELGTTPASLVAFWKF